MGMPQVATTAALAEIYRERYRVFLRTATAITHSREVGKMWYTTHSFRPSVSNEASAATGPSKLGFGRFSCGLRSRRDRRSSGSRSTKALTTWEDSASNGDAIRAAISALPDRQRLLVFLRYYGDLDYASIAQAAEIKLGTVGAELHAAHAARRRHLQEVSYDAGP